MWIAYLSNYLVILMIENSLDGATLLKKQPKISLY